MRKRDAIIPALMLLMTGYMVGGCNVDWYTRRECKKAGYVSGGLMLFGSRYCTVKENRDVTVPYPPSSDSVSELRRHRPNE